MEREPGMGASAAQGGGAEAGAVLRSAVLTAALGLGALRYWALYNPYVMLTGTDPSNLTAMYVLRGLGCLALALWAAGHPVKPRARLALGWAAMALMVLSGVAAYLEGVVDSASPAAAVWSWARYLTCAAGAAGGAAMWMDAVGRMAPRPACASLLLAYAVSCVLQAALWHVPTGAVQLVNLFIPIASLAACLSCGAALDQAGARGPSWDGRRPGRGFPPGYWRLLAATALFALAMGIIFHYPNDGTVHRIAPQARDLYQLLNVGIIALLGLPLLRGHAFPARGLAVLVNALFVASVAAIAAGYADPAGVSTALRRQAFGFATLAAFLLAYALGREEGVDQTHSLNILYGAGYTLPFGAGLALGQAVTGSVGLDVLLLVVLCLVAAEAVLVATVSAGAGRPTAGGAFAAGGAGPAVAAPGGSPDPAALGREGRPAGGSAEGAPGAPAQAGPLAEGTAPAGSERPTAAPGLGGLGRPGAPSSQEAAANRARTAREFGLTPVEAEIAELMLNGRSRSFIAGELGYSENTVRNYAHSLYTKLGVHAKQQLIDLLEREGWR